MELEHASIARFRLPLEGPLETAHGTTRVREGALLCLRAAGGQRGFGETMPLPGFGLEPLPIALARLARAARSLLGGRPCGLAAALAIAARETADAPGARAALETALLDLAARRRGVRVATLLGPTARTRIEVAALLAAKTPREVGEAARAALRAGFRTVKLKVGATTLERDLARVQGARDALGSSVALRLDANGGWDEPTAHEALARLAALAPEYVEQPVPASATDALARLRAASPVPIAADESAASAAGAAAVIARRAADLLIVKPATLGGPRRAIALARRARAAGIETVTTGFLDSALGDAAALHVAAVLGGRAAGLGFQGLFRRDLATGPGCRAGTRPLPSGPGLGVAPDPARLAAALCGAPLHVHR